MLMLSADQPNVLRNLDMLSLPSAELFNSARCHFPIAKLEFILNYDIKYRLGRGAGEEE